MATVQTVFTSEDSCGVDCTPLSVGKNYTIWVKKERVGISDQSDKKIFESTIQALKSEIANAGTYMVMDSSVRKTYAQQILVFSERLRERATQGVIPWSQAASEAQQVRNTVMMTLRGKSTPLGRAIAESLKREGKTLNELIARKTIQLYGTTTDFNSLSTKKKNTIYAEIVKSAGKSNSAVNSTMSKLSKAGRGLIVISIALSVYTIATADDKTDATKREVVVTGAGVGGGLAGGALAGLACGPGAPVCVVVGAFVGGALAAFSVDYLW